MDIAQGQNGEIVHALVDSLKEGAFFFITEELSFKMATETIIHNSSLGASRQISFMLRTQQINLTSLLLLNDQ